MRCVLLYNPVAGRNRQERKAVVEQVAEALRSQGHSAEVIATTAPGSAAGLARDAASAAEVVFACGGDGTVHEVVQGLVSETEVSAATLGIVPLGSANALARHLGLPLDPVKAALSQLNGKSCSIPVGKVSRQDGSRYFTVMAGAGPDGALVYDMLSAHKSQIGRIAYYIDAARLFLTQRFPAFEVEWTRAADGAVLRRKAVEVMAVRVGNLGGIFSGLTDPRATIHDTALKLHIVSPPAWLSLPLWFLMGWLRVIRLNPFLECVEATRFSCRPIGAAPVNAQADGEWLGALPFEASVLPHSLRLLLPGE